MPFEFMFRNGGQQVFVLARDNLLDITPKSVRAYIHRILIKIKGWEREEVWEGKAGHSEMTHL